MAEYGRRVSDVYPVVKAQRLNVKLLPGAQPADLLSGLRDSARSGLIVILGREADDVDGEREWTVPISALAEAVNDLGGDNLFWHLTEEGGRAWERAAAPDWRRYVGETHGPEDMIASSQSIELLFAALGAMPVLSGWQPQRESLQIALHSTWRMLYWKTLPDVYVLTCQGHDLPSLLTPSQQLRTLDYLQALEKWRRRPWESEV